jgi:hypothetical protein
MPGTGFKRIGAAWRKSLMDAANKPYNFAKEQITQGIQKPSYISKLFAQKNGILSPEEEMAAKWSAATLYAAGSETVSRVAIAWRFALHADV